MRVVLQRVKEAKVSVEGRVVGAIGTGYLLLLGAEQEDTEETADRMMDKICRLRIFQDESGKTNRSLADVGGEILVVSQFTLYADCKKGNRPSFTKAGDPLHARQLYEYCLAECKKLLPVVDQGAFGEHMKIQLENDGPFTVLLDTEEL